MKHCPVTITDHALIRYMERAHGIDFTRFRRRLEDIATLALRAGANTCTADGVKLVITHDAKVLTAIEKKNTRNAPLAFSKLDTRLK